MASLAFQVAAGAAALVVVLLIVGGLAGWCYAAVAWYRGRALLPPEPRLRPSWQFSEVLLCFGLYMVLAIMLQGALVRPASAAAAATDSAVPAASAPQSETGILNPPDGPRPTDSESQPLDKRTLGLAITADGVAKTLAVAGVLLWMTMLDRRSPRRLGMWIQRSDWKIGLVAAAMLLPPVLALQALLNLWTKYQHPVLDVIHQGPGLWLGLAMAVNTVAIAPVAEEFFFRGLLQGWLQRRAGASPAQPPLAAGAATALRPIVADWENPDLGPDDAPLATPDLLTEPAATMISSDQVARWPWWPMIVASLLFAVVHLGQGAAPIPLFVLALGLGYLYRQTGRLAAPILVHMILNGLSTAITFLTAAAPTT